MKKKKEKTWERTYGNSSRSDKNYDFSIEKKRQLVRATAVPILDKIF